METIWHGSYGQLEPESRGQDPESPAIGYSSFLPSRGTRDKVFSACRQRRHSVTMPHIGSYSPNVASLPRLSPRKGAYCVTISFEFEASLPHEKEGTWKTKFTRVRKVLKNIRFVKSPHTQGYTNGNNFLPAQLLQSGHSTLEMESLCVMT